ncbi:hypothetical protein D5F01_LYC04793 [Larimichthys crocea]|uniref:Uncharacterized protein n=1 Tax=Larimichthys crocea TaxID=215358 RepID=A0A6G0IXN1_LARCR|nr:hypothetical protein D5F01_LYC04793 [Larimichthys crocea]
MLPGDQVPVDGTEEQSNPTKGSASLKSGQEILSTCDPFSRGNPISTDLISTQPLPAAAPSAEASQEAAGLKKPQCDPEKPTCPRCGLRVPDHRLPPQSSGLSRLQGSSLSVQSSKRSRSRAHTNLLQHLLTPVYICCWHACRARAPCCSRVCWRPAPPASTPFARPAATPAPAAVRPSRRRPWKI